MLLPTYLALLLSAAPLPSGERAPSIQPASSPSESELGREFTLAGQAAVCGTGARSRTFELRAEEKTVDVGNGSKAEVMTLGGRLAPTLEACEGDTVTLRVINAGQMAHGIDSHALRMSPEHFGPVDAGGTVELTGKVGTPGAFMFHCASGPVTDVHIKSGMWGAMIIYPRKALPKAKDVAILQGGFFGDPDEQGVIHSDTTRMANNNPYTLTYNGRLEHEMVTVKIGERVRVWFVNAGPGIASPHVMGTMFDRVAASGNPKNAERDVQTALVPAGGGAMIEFRLPEKGMFMFVDHDNLRYLPYGFAIGFMATDEPNPTVSTSRP